MHKLLLAGAALLLFVVGTFYVLLESKTPKAIAATIVERCTDASYRPSCYEEEVPKLLADGLSFEDAFLVALEVQALDRSAEYCHNIGHRLGAFEVAKDPSKWKEVARRTPLGKCLNGGMHGAFQERFRNESLAPERIPAFIEEMRGFCDPREDLPSGLIDLSMCAHGLGHLFVFVAAGNVERALPLCAAIGFSDAPGVSASGLELSCYDGLFMQLFEPHEPEDHALIAGKAETSDTVAAFCAGFEGLPKVACIARSISLFRESNPSGFEGLECGTLMNDRERNACRSTQLRLFARDTFLDVEAADTYCAESPADRRGWCYASAGSYAFMAGYDYDVPFAFCEHAGPAGAQCYETLAGTIRSMFGHDPAVRSSLCDRLPSPYDEVCLKSLDTDTR